VPPSWRLELPADADEYRRRVKKRSKGCFYDIKKARASELRVREADSTADLRRFYRLYLLTMRRHRSIPRPFREMALARVLLGPRVVRLFLAELDSRPVAGLLCHFFNGMVEAMYNASDERYRHLRPNHAVYDRAITAAIEMRLAHFDFGCAWPEESLAAFKRHWGSEPVERFGYTYPADVASSLGGAAPSRVRAQAPASRRWVARTWDKVPPALTRLAGEVAWKYL
jgi:lipid II:glycine glycyltransferase (peptidoglycan interpeptide bridge formation enzyme)